MSRSGRAALAGLLALASAGGPVRSQQPVVEETPIDVPHRRIVEPGYDASTSLRIGEPGDAIQVEVGAAVHASRVVIEIHQARGSYRFYADGSELESALQRGETTGRREQR